MTSRQTEIKRYYLRKSLVKKIFNEILNEFPELKDYLKKRVEIIELNRSFSFIVIERNPLFIKYKNMIFPSLKLLREINLNKYWILVDKGAAKSILNGADLMRPGVLDYDKNIKKDSLVYIKYENFPIAIGYNLWSIEEFEKNKKGKCVKNIHYHGDKYTLMCQQLGINY